MASVRSNVARFWLLCMFSNPNGTFDCPTRRRWTLSVVRYTSPYQSRICGKCVWSGLPVGVMAKSGWK